MNLGIFSFLSILFLGFCLAILSNSAFAQSSDSSRMIQLEDATIRDKNAIIRPISLDRLPFDSLLFSGYTNLPEALQLIPGIQVLSTGPGNNKPVIRGAFGTRLILLVDGLKFGNQQWQDEHGLGLGTMGISGIEIIKGPMSILYGSEAIAGVIKLQDELAPLPNTSVSDILLKGESNGLGFGLEAGYKENIGKYWTRIRVSTDNYADYSDGNNQRVLNSRYDAYRLKMSIGKLKGNRSSITSFYSSYTRSGFLFKDLNSFAQEDNRWSRRMSVNPAHFVILNMLNTSHSWYFNSSNKLSIKAAFRSNQRLENEGSGAISLNMLLLSQQYHLRWDHQLNSKNRLTLSHIINNDFNSNYGARVLVPDAHLFESNFATVLHSELSKLWQWENGFGLGFKSIKTRKTGIVGPIPKELGLVKMRSPYLNASSSVYFQNKQGLSINAALASGVRVPNLAELASEGLHEGFFTYEIGNPNLKNERVISLNLGLELQKKRWKLAITPFVNRFFDYIYLAPTQEIWFGFPVYRYKQTQTYQLGGEVQSEYLIGKYFSISAVYAAMESKTLSGINLPNTPAQKVSGILKFIFKQNSLGIRFMSLTSEFVSGQGMTYPGEIASRAYQLYHLNTNGKHSGKMYSINYGISLRNLFNTTYFNHLSRLKLFGLYDQGRTLNFQIKIERIQKG